MEEYVYLITPKRENFIDSMTQEEITIMSKHFEYLKELLAQHTLILAGPCLDGSFGIVIFKAESLKAAQVLMENDPAVSAGIMSAELHPYRVSLLQNGSF